MVVTFSGGKFPFKSYNLSSIYINRCACVVSNRLLCGSLFQTEDTTLGAKIAEVC